jgi:hypothetical protein
LQPSSFRFGLLRPPNSARRRARRVHPVLSQHHYHWADRLTPSPRLFGYARAPHAHACACGPPANPFAPLVLLLPLEPFGPVWIPPPGPMLHAAGAAPLPLHTLWPARAPRWAVPQPLRARLAASGNCGLDLWHRAAWRMQALEGVSEDGAAAAWAAAAGGAAGLAALDASDAFKVLMCRTFCAACPHASLGGCCLCCLAVLFSRVSSLTPCATRALGRPSSFGTHPRGVPPRLPPPNSLAGVVAPLCRQSSLAAREPSLHFGSCLLVLLVFRGLALPSTARAVALRSVASSPGFTPRVLAARGVRCN